MLQTEFSSAGSTHPLPIWGIPFYTHLFLDMGEDHTMNPECSSIRAPSDISSRYHRFNFSLLVATNKTALPEWVRIPGDQDGQMVISWEAQKLFKKGARVGEWDYMDEETFLESRELESVSAVKGWMDEWMG